MVNGPSLRIGAMGPQNKNAKMLFTRYQSAKSALKIAECDFRNIVCKQRLAYANVREAQKKNVGYTKLHKCAKHI